MRRGDPPAEAPSRPSRPQADVAPAPELVPVGDGRPRRSRSRRTTRWSRTSRRAGGAVEVDQLELASPAVDALRAAGVALVVPLVSGGELVGTLNLGPRLSDQQYSTDDKRLLDSLAAQAAPALQVAELVRRQAAEAASRERIEQELRVAQLIQQNFLPRELPELAGWQLDAYYKPAREVGGDFYDFFELPDGRLGVVVGDVTDKGVPAAMVMAAAQERAPRDRRRGRLAGRDAAAGQRAALPRHPREDVRHLPLRRDRPRVGPLPSSRTPGTTCPYARTADGAVELRATGMPLGLLPGHGLRGEGGGDRARRGAAPLLRRRHRGALDRRARCTGRRGSASSSRARRI